ncbi:MAG: hypothetical protein JSS27_08565 [Planctomycetes bacterium]|nr:hypothetical protein [Planctomycetota bacterium]
MIDPTIQEQILASLSQLTSPQQQRVADYAKSLGKTSAGSLRRTPGSELLDFFDVISDEDAAEMTKAIEEGCERIDNEW